MNEPNVNPIQQTSESVNSIRLHKDKPQKTAQDWVRDMRMSAAVNKATTGVETDQVTPDLLLATSKRLLGISKREQEPDPKDSLAFQRFYGPEMLFSEHILRDNGKLGRNILWKATNKGSLDFMPVNALEKHISSVFYDSKLAQMMDGSSPLETIDSAYKTTRLGEGGIGSIESAPDEMRTVQPSYFGYIDPIRSPESLRVGLDVYMTKNVMKGTDGKLYQKFIDAKTGKEVLLDSETAANSVVAAPEMMDAKTKSIFALGGPTGIRIVPRDSVQYYLPRADEAYSTASNLVTMLSGVKNMRVQMGCLHPDTLVLSIDKKGLISTTKAQKLSTGSLPGSTEEGISKVFPIRTTVAKFLPKKNWFRKIILKSGRSLITSADHRWSVLRNGEYILIPADKLKPGDIALRTIFKDVPSRRTFVNHMLVNKELARVFGYIARSLDEPDNKKMRIQIPEDQYPAFLKAMERIGYTEGFNTYTMDYSFCVGIRDENLKQLLRDLFGATDKVRHIPTEILSAGAVIVGAFLDGYTADPTKVGRDSNDDFWILDIPNLQTRDELAFLFSRIETDTLYRDKVSGKAIDLALKLVPIGETYGDMIMDEIKLVQDKINAPIMIDIDVDDNLYATANGVVTHNSKYPLQAVSIESREAPLVRGLDEASGKDMHSLIGKYLGARFAPQDGVVTAVRKDRIDVLYDDGTKGQVGLYVNFPMNAKGYINNTPVVKAGQAFKKGDVLASSNYTDDKGVAAIGTNLRTGWLSWKGGTYEDAVVISESAAKKLTSTTMYKTAVDLDKTISLGKQNYITWKPGEFSKEQMDNLDANGIVKPGTVLHKEDPMILAVRTSEPSPGTMGKRILTDLSERWEHDNPGVVTDVVKTRNGVKVYATVTAPAEIGDKLSNGYGAKGTVSMIVPDDEMPHNAKGEPLEMLFSPLGLITRCYDEETEFLTRDGWKFGKDVQDTDELYCYDTQSDTWSWDKQLEPFYSNHYIGTMYEYHGRVTDFSVTYGHKIWSATIGCEYKQRQIQDVFGKNIHVPCVAQRLGQPKEHPFVLPMVDGARINIPDTYDAGDWAEFLGWFLSEGYVAYQPEKGRYEITITQFASINPVKVKMIHSLLQRLDLPYTYSKDEKRFRIHNKRLASYFSQFGKSHEKFIPDWLFEQPDYVINRFLDAMLLGDGSITPDKSRNDGKPSYRCRIKLTSEKLIDQLQMLFCMIGIPTVKTALGNDPRYPESKEQFYLGISMADTTERRLDKGWQKREYDGMVYCPTVATGYILTRRHGRVIILSNTNPAQLYEAQLGKIARKTGKPVVVPPFFKGSMQEYVTDQLKQHHISPDEDLINPETGLPIKDVLTGVSYIYKLKHLSESKMSARGTSSYDCYSADTDVLTAAGWKPWPEVTLDDRFWTCKDGVWFYAQASKLHVYDIDDDMVHITSRYIDSLVTKNHKHLVDLMGHRAARGEYTKLMAEELLTRKRFNMPQFGYMPVESNIEKIHIPDYTEIIGKRVVTHNGYDIDAVAIAALTGWLASEGSIPKAGADHKNRCSITQLVEHTTECEDIEKTLSACGLQWHKIVRLAEGSGKPLACYTFNDSALTAWMRENCGTHSSNKRIPRELMLYTNTRAAFFRSYMLGDGSETDRIRAEGPYTWMNTHCRATTVSKGLADDLMELAMLEGFGAACRRTVRTAGPTGKRFNYPVWDISFHKKRTCATIDTSNPRYTGKVELEHYIGKVYCATIPETGILCVRRNGKILISGNSEQQPAGKGMDGCFPATQLIRTREGKRSIAAIARAVGIERVASISDNKERRFSTVIDRFVRAVPAEELLTITPTWGYDGNGRKCKAKSMHPTKNHAIYMYDMTQKHAVDIKPGEKIAGLGMRPSDHQMQVIWNLMHQAAIVDHDELWVPYDPEADKLARFKVSILKSLGAKLKDGHIRLPNYRVYQAALEDTDQGDLAIALKGLDKAAEAGYELSSCVKQLIAVWIPAAVIPDYAYTAKELAVEQQRLADPVELDVEPHMGLMPMIVARVNPYRCAKSSVRVYDLTVEDTHRYVLDGGFLVSNSKRFGTLEQSALAGHTAFDVIKDAKWIRGQSNSDFWRSLRTGDIPTMPGEPLVHKKFFAHLTGAGINVRKTPQGVSIFALTNNDVNELAGPRELRSRDTYEARNFRPIDGGLFGQDIFGINGDKWAYIKLDEPVPNPVMEEPLAKLLNIPEKKFADVASGKEEVNGIRGGVAMKEALAKLDLGVEAERAHQAFKTASASNKDKALKRYVAIERMRRAGVNPSDYMLDKIPVLPPVYRPISSHNGLTMVADSNYLYAQLLDARDDAREAKNLPKEFQQTARENIYSKWKELTGLYAPSDVKLQSKHVQGLLKWALGDSPKFSGYQRKVLSATVDTVGRGVITPDSRLKVNEVGIPEEMAFNIMAPMVERSLVKRGYTPIQAMEMVKKHSVQARDVLNEVMKDHPVLMNRAPTLHKLSVMAFNPRLVEGHAIHVNPSIVVPFAADFDGDTVNIHAPVSDKARQEAYAKMFPERNLIAMRSRTIAYKPEKEYQQGLYIGTRVKQGADVRTHYFNTLEEAKEAYRQGLIDLDDPIEIKSK